MIRWLRGLWCGDGSVWAIESQYFPGEPIHASIGVSRWWLLIAARAMSKQTGHRFRLIRVGQAGGPASE